MTFRVVGSTLDDREIRQILSTSTLSPQEVARNLASHHSSDFAAFVFGSVLDRLAIIVDSSGVGYALSARGDTIRHRVFGLLSSASFAPFSQDGLVALLVSPAALRVLQEPSVLLISLYKPQNFPIPRFALGISGIAAALREQCLGEVSLRDMQLGDTLATLVEAVRNEKPRIVGISATFGQHDLLVELLEQIFADSAPQMVVVGGSLVARNAPWLLARFPRVIVCHGPGEGTIQHLVRACLGRETLNDVPGIAFVEADLKTVSTRSTFEWEWSGVPELDLLPRTLERRGAMQLETSRGCTFACSFCPRDHKGIWKPNDPRYIEAAVHAIAGVYDRTPHVPRRLFLVDEEFVGYSRDDSVVDRAKVIAAALHRHGFVFENSTRVDQVYRSRQDVQWHERRVAFWRYLVAHGLRRMLFGVESGVDSILRRFNKKTIASQNVAAVRILSACGVPVRLTYITFDPLMSMAELVESYTFQGRSDCLLNVLENHSADFIVALAEAEVIDTNTRGVPLYHEIPYMLVSMECLLGSPYLTMVEDAGLARDTNLAMGRRDAEYLDPRIGLMSHASQCWIDRSFALDYALKGIEKIADDRAAFEVRGMRMRMRDYSYSLLGLLLAGATSTDRLIDGLRAPASQVALEASRKAFTIGLSVESAATQLEEVLDVHFALLRDDVLRLLDGMLDHLSSADASIVVAVTEVWATKAEWSLINGQYFSDGSRD